jgi:hypothetical protein
MERVARNDLMKKRESSFVATTRYQRGAGCGRINLPPTVACVTVRGTSIRDFAETALLLCAA